jgi:preprotein translocase subunit SecA
MHQAIEAKEGVVIKAENQTLATITLQNYFRLYDKLAGMTGTAQTEAAEFMSTYKLGVVPIPTNKPMIRKDQSDLVYKNEDAKYKAVVQDIVERHAAGQPVLVGTVSVEKSELLSQMLRRMGVPHEVLNAKQHAREASIVAQAGRKGAVTVATNMAGRGTDIMLGGNAEFMAVQALAERGLDPAENPEEYEAAWPAALESAREASAAEHDEVVDLGGLYVLGTERHESRRIDNQLRGRSGRQGDPGESRFYLSMTDDLMRLFNSGMAESLMNRAAFPDDVPLESKIVSRSIQSAQTQVEGRNFEIRKNVLKYDDVMSRQREVIYTERRRVLEGEDLHEQIQLFVADVVADYVEEATTERTPESWDLAQLWTALKLVFPVSITPDEVVEEAGSETRLTRDLIVTELQSDARHAYLRREEELGEENMRQLERRVVLSVLDRKWREHLYEMDYLKDGIGLRAMAQRDPLVEYQREGFQLFNAMMDGIKEDSVSFLYNLEVKVADAADAANGQAADGAAASDDAGPVTETEVDDAAAEPTATVPPVRSGGKRARQSAGAAGAGATAPVPAAAARPAAASVAGGSARSTLIAKGLEAPERRAPLQYSAPSVDGDAKPQTAVAGGGGVVAAEKDGQTYPGTPRNAPCPCGSGKKYKVCHGKNEE